VIEKFSPFSEDFEKMYDLDFDSLWKFCYKLYEYIEFKKQMTVFSEKSYKFKNREEYANLGFVAVPPRGYVKRWESIVTFSMYEIKRLLSSQVSPREIDVIMDQISLNQTELRKKREIRFPAKPFLATENDWMVLLTPRYLTRSLPSIYEALFKDVRRYRDSKGGSFEKLGQATLKSLPFTALGYNVVYGDNLETDAVLRFKDSVWFVEITSHPPSAKSLSGDLTSIKTDLRKTVKKCIKQGKRCFQHLNEPALSGYVGKAKHKGIIIVVDGVYPQLNLNTALQLFEEETPVYIINWFDLRTITNEPEVEEFGSFLLWRTQQPMPIVCVDEKDYWAYYFDFYRRSERAKEEFEIMQKKLIRKFYISYRFNNKEYLEEIVKKEQ
jgi:hypothetical protein